MRDIWTEGLKDLSSNEWRLMGTQTVLAAAWVVNFFDTLNEREIVVDLN